MTVPFTEPIAVADVFASGLCRVEPLSGGNMRFTFYAEQTSIMDGEKERVIVQRLVMDVDAVRDAVLTVLTALKCPPACISHIPNLCRH
ncbi:MAG: hypothetical protein LCH86_09835 [Proteobacteria bacterium]|nr:hypothetical protein [Pseudomonadota bacterium]